MGVPFYNITSINLINLLCVLLYTLFRIKCSKRRNIGNEKNTRRQNAIHTHTHARMFFYFALLFRLIRVAFSYGTMVSLSGKSESENERTHTDQQKIKETAQRTHRQTVRCKRKTCVLYAYRLRRKHLCQFSGYNERTRGSRCIILSICRKQPALFRAGKTTRLSCAPLC